MSSLQAASTGNMLLADSSSRTSMDNIKFSHIWTVENVSFFLNRDFITSPPFGARSDPRTRWSLDIIVGARRMDGDNSLTIRLRRLSSELDEILVRCEFFLLDVDGRVIETLTGGLSLWSCSIKEPVWGLTAKSSLESLLERDKFIVRCEISYRSGKEDIPRQESRILSDCDSTGFLRELYGNQMLCDVILSCDGKDFHAHRVVLAARSPILKAMFELDHNRGRTSHIDMVNIEERTLQDLLRFIYTGETDVPDNMHNLLDTIDRHAQRK